MTIAGFLLRQFATTFARFRVVHNFGVNNLLCKVKQRYCIEQREYAIVCCKEFIDDLIKDAFETDSSATTALHQLFSVTPLETLAVNTDYATNMSLLPHYEFLGRAVGKAVYESILVEPQFCLPFLNQLLGKSNSMHDLKNFDPEYHKNLTKLLVRV